MDNKRILKDLSERIVSNVDTALKAKQPRAWVLEDTYNLLTETMWKYGFVRVEKVPVTTYRNARPPKKTKK